LLAELLGFYYDKEKNRYSPLKGSIPGSSSSSTKNAQEPSTANTQVSVSCVCVCVCGLVTTASKPYPQACLYFGCLAKFTL